VRSKTKDRRLKHIVAERVLDIAALKGVLGKNGDARREAENGERHERRILQEPDEELQSRWARAIHLAVQV
jgi:hypothetical protein